MKEKYDNCFKVQKPIIGMIHLLPLPGTPLYRGSIDEIIDTAAEEMELYKSGGIDALMIENMHDVPYLNKSVGPEITSIMSIVAHLVKSESNLPCGIQILAGNNIKALCSAKSAKLDFIRSETFVFSHIGDEGGMEADAGELLRYRKMIEGEEIMIFSDIKKKHSSHATTADVSLLETAKAAEFFLSDGVIVTGSSTGHSASIQDLESLLNKLNMPTLIGSGITIDNVEQYIGLCDGMIVGSYFKKNGDWKEKVDRERVSIFMEKMAKLRA